MSEPAPRSNPDLVSVARVIQSTTAEGPGERTAIWVQGCSIRCHGCFNPHLWAFRNGNAQRPAELAAVVVQAGTEGVTLLGGEPFDHAAGLAVLAREVRRAGRSVMTFTGYTTSELRDAVAAGRDDIEALLTETDLLVAGPFLADQIDTARPWVGSTNQEFLALSDRYRNLVSELTSIPDRVEVRVDRSGQIAVNGWAELDVLDRLLSEDPR
jgi:anaerobic ribonucleoside-triphosphate reductase activating protein